MIEIDDIKDYLKENLTEKRYNHSIGVAEEAVRLAERYGSDTEKAYLTGLIHDCAKEIKYDEAVSLLQDKYNVVVDAVTLNTYKLLHGPLGTCIAQDKFGVCDLEILDAIKYHTTGKAAMSMFTKIIYIADYIEPNRTFDGVEDLRKLAYEDIDKAILLGIDWTITELVEKGSMFHPDTVHARNYLLLEKTNK